MHPLTYILAIPCLILAHAAVPLFAAEEGRQEQPQQQANQPPSSAEIDAARKLIREFVGTWPDAWSRRSESGQRQLAQSRQYAEALRWLMDHEEMEFHRVAAFTLLTESHQDALRKDILHALENSSDRVRGPAVFHLPRILSGDVLITRYIELLKDPSSLVRYYVVRAFQSHPSQKAIQPLIGLLDDPSIEVRSVVPVTLLRWEMPEARAALEEAAGSDNVVAAGTAMVALAQREGAPIKLPVLHAYLRRELPRLTGPPFSGVGDVVTLIRLIGERGDASSLPVLAEATQHKHTSVQEAAWEMIDQIRSRTSEARDARPETEQQERDREAVWEMIDQIRSKISEARDARLEAEQQERDREAVWEMIDQIRSRTSEAKDARPEAEQQERDREAIVVEVTPSAVHIRALDPVYLRIDVHNRGSYPLPLRQPLGAIYGTVTLEVKHESSERFEPRRMPDQGEVAVGVGRSFGIDPGATYTTYELVLTYYDGEQLVPIFDRAGFYTLRFEVRSGDRRFRSRPIGIRVDTIARDQRALIQRNLRTLYDGLHPYRSVFSSSGLGREGSDAMRRLGDLRARLELDDSHRLKTVLDRLTDIRNRISPDERAMNQAIGHLLKQLDPGTDPVLHEVALYWIAKAHETLRHWESARRYFSQLPESCYAAQRALRNAELELSRQQSAAGEQKP